MFVDEIKVQTKKLSKEKWNRLSQSRHEIKTRLMMVAWWTDGRVCVCVWCVCVCVFVCEEVRGGVGERGLNEDRYNWQKLCVASSITILKARICSQRPPSENTTISPESSLMPPSLPPRPLDDPVRQETDLKWTVNQTQCVWLVLRQMQLQLFLCFEIYIIRLCLKYLDKFRLVDTGRA